MTTIRWRLTGRLLILLVLIFGTGLALMYAALRHASLAAFDDALRAEAMSVVSMTEMEHGSVHLDLPESLVNVAKGAGRRSVFRVYDRTGKRTLGVTPGIAEGYLPDDLAGDEAHPAFRNMAMPDGRTGRAIGIVYNPVMPERPGKYAEIDVHLVLVTSRHKLDESLEHLLFATLGAAGVMLLTTAIFVPLAIRSELRPLDALGRRVLTIDAASLDGRFPTAGLPNELGTITDRLNDLLGRLQWSFERERRFSADVAHELRTPVAELKSLAECARRWPDMRTDSLCDDMVDVTVRMELLVTRMLALASCENRIAPIHSEPTELAELIGETFAAFAGKAGVTDVTVSFSLRETTVMTDPVPVRSIIGNLLENAVSYSPKDAVVHVACGDEDGGAFIRVINPAPDLTPADMDHLFEGFWRKDKSRTDRHAGLGLTLSRAFANSIGWSLTASLSPAGEISFLLRSGAASAQGAVRPSPRT